MPVNPASSFVPTSRLVASAVDTEGRGSCPYDTLATYVCPEVLTWTCMDKALGMLPIFARKLNGELHMIVIYSSDTCYGGSLEEALILLLVGLIVHEP